MIKSQFPSIWNILARRKVLRAISFCTIWVFECLSEKSRAVGVECAHDRGFKPKWTTYKPSRRGREKINKVSHITRAGSCYSVLSKPRALLSYFTFVLQQMDHVLFKQDLLFFLWCVWHNFPFFSDQGKSALFFYFTKSQCFRNSGITLYSR